ncbi:MAG: transglutaminaseTgpA domain-containing protein [Vicinamibacteria bacterium]
MRTEPLTLPHAFLCAFVFCAGLSTAFGLRSWVFAIYLVLPVIALGSRVTLPGWLATSARRVARLGAVVAFLCGLFLSILPASPEAIILSVSRISAHALVVAGGVLLLGRRPPGGTVMPAMLGSVIASCLQPDSLFARVSLAASFISMVGWLATNDDEEGRPVSLRPFALVFFLVITAAATAGAIAFLPWAQPQVELMVAKMISDDLSASTGLSTQSRLGDIERLATSNRVAMRMYGDHPADLRVRAFTRFDGRAWQADPRPARRLGQIPMDAARWPAFDETPGVVLATHSSDVSGDLMAARLIVTSPQQGAMPVPARAVAVRVEDVTIDRNPSGILFPASKAALYAVLFRENEGEEAGDSPGAEMLELPERLDPRLRELALKLAPADLPQAQRAERIAAYFQSGYRYSLDVGKLATSDPLAEFVFDKKQGYCEYFATATTLLLRLSGVPARYVTGYAVRSFQRSGAHYVIRDQDAHAWAEAYLPDRGWVEVDATPANDYAAVHDDLKSEGWLARLQGLWDEMAARFAQGGVVGLARGLAALAMEHPVPLVIVFTLFIASRLRRARAVAPSPVVSTAPFRTAAQSLHPEIERLLRAVDELCLSRGAPRSPFRAPREHVNDQTVLLASGEREVCLRAIDLVYAHTYGGRSGAEGENAELISTLDGLKAPSKAS